MLTPELAPVEPLDERHRSLNAERELRSDDQRNALVVEIVGDAGVRRPHVGDLPTVAAR
jgi:hypothetical protein